MDVYTYGLLVFDKEAKTSHSKKTQYLEQWYFSNRMASCQIQPHLLPCAKQLQTYQRPKSKLSYTESDKRESTQYS